MGKYGVLNTIDSLAKEIFYDGFEIEILQH
jgi:hypothetical protein